MKNKYIDDQFAKKAKEKDNSEDFGYSVIIREALKECE